MRSARPTTLPMLALLGALLLAPAARGQGSGPPADVVPPSRPTPAPDDVPPASEPAEPPALEEPDGAAVAPGVPATEAPAAVPLASEVPAFLAEHAAALAAWHAASRAGTPPGPHPDLAAGARAKELVAAGWADGRLWLLARAECLWPDPATRARETRVLAEALLGTAAPDSDVEPLALALGRAAGDLATTREEAARWEARASELLSRAQGRAATGAALAAVGALASRAAAPDDAAAAGAAATLLDVARRSFADTAGAKVAAHASFVLLEREHARALDAHWRRAPDAPVSEDPTLAFWPRVRELAELGVGPARWWLVVHAGTAIADPAERRTIRAAQLDRLVADHASEAWLADAVRVAETLTSEFGADVVRALGERLLDASDQPEVRAWTLHNLALSYARDRADPRASERARALLARLTAEQPDHRLARAAEPLAFELEHLRFDQVPPDFVSRDVDGREVRLSHTRGLVTVLLFWGNWSPPSVALARELVALEQRFADAPFTVLGVVTDSDPDAYRRARAELGSGWVDAWQGSPGGPWPAAWGVREFPRTYVFDAHGRLRYRDLDGVALGSALRRLVREALPGYEPAVVEAGSPAGATPGPPADDVPEPTPNGDASAPSDAR